jgi:hypothetical protein
MKIPDAAVEAGVAEAQRITAAPDLEAERIGDETPEGFVVRAVLAAALPHLLTDEMVEAAAGALWDHREREERRWGSYVDPGDLRDLRAEARAALEAALVRDV